MKFRFSGHESFPCRYTWLPKAYHAITLNPEIFNDDNNAMVTLGVGKNMVRSIRFWVQAFSIAGPAPTRPGFAVTDFGRSLFGPEGVDPYLEDMQTLWLLHWKLSSIKDDPLFAWYFLLFRWAEPQFSRSKILAQFTKESNQMDRQLSDFTKDQHFDIFLHSYVPVRSKKSNEVLEDSLDCPLNELQFILPAGERMLDQTDKREPVYEFNSENNSLISDKTFVYCLFDYWRKFQASEMTISFRDVTAAVNSVGQVFKLSEPDLRIRLERIHNDSNGLFEYLSSAAIPRVIKNTELEPELEQKLLNEIYQPVGVQ